MEIRKLLLLGMLFFGGCRTLLSAEDSEAGSAQAEKMVIVIDEQQKVYLFKMMDGKILKINKQLLEKIPVFRGLLFFSDLVEANIVQEKIEWQGKIQIDTIQEEDKEKVISLTDFDIDSEAFILLLNYMEKIILLSLVPGVDGAKKIFRNLLMEECKTDEQKKIDTTLNIVQIVEFLCISLYVDDGEENGEEKTIALFAQVLVDLLIEQVSAIQKGVIKLPQEINNVEGYVRIFLKKAIDYMWKKFPYACVSVVYHGGGLNSEWYRLRVWEKYNDAWISKIPWLANDVFRGDVELRGGRLYCSEWIGHDGVESTWEPFMVDYGKKDGINLAQLLAAFYVIKRGKGVYNFYEGPLDVFYDSIEEEIKAKIESYLPELGIEDDFYHLFEETISAMVKEVIILELDEAKEAVLLEQVFQDLEKELNQRAARVMEPVELQEPENDNVPEPTRFQQFLQARPVRIAALMFAATVAYRCTPERVRAWIRDNFVTFMRWLQQRFLRRALRF